MTVKIKLLVAIDMLFLLLLALAGSSAGIISEIFYHLAFIAPVGIVLNHLYLSDKKTPLSEVKANMFKDIKQDFSISKESVLLTLPIILPATLATLALSFATSFFMGMFGFAAANEFNEPFVVAIITHALIPAVLEELLFRFAAIKLLRDNAKTAILLSSVMFSFAHANLFQIPYAFLAGFVFASLYVITGSIIPSMFLHFINNTFSLFLMYGYFRIWLYPVLFVLLVISVIAIIKSKKHYAKKLGQKFSNASKIELSYHPLIFIGLSLILSLSSIFS